MAEGEGLAVPTGSSRQCQRRLATFKRWPKDAGQKAERLAKEGFIHTGKRDEVECVYCGIRLFDWLSGTDPTKVHFEKTKGFCRFAKRRMDERRSHFFSSIGQSHDFTSGLGKSMYKSIAFVRDKSPKKSLILDSKQNAADLISHETTKTEDAGIGSELSHLSDTATNMIHPGEKQEAVRVTANHRESPPLLDARGGAEDKNRIDTSLRSHRNVQSPEDDNGEIERGSDEISHTPTEEPDAFGGRKPPITTAKRSERDPLDVTKVLVSPKDPNASAMLAMSYKDTSFQAAQGIPDKYYVNSFIDTDVVQLVMKRREWSAKLLREVIQKGLATGEEVFTTAERLTKAVYDYLDQEEALKNRENPNVENNN